MRILGLDISSSTIGICVLDILQDNSIKFIGCDFIKPIKTGAILDRLKSTQDKIKVILEKYKPDHIGIEDIIKFMANKSSAQSIITLATYNRAVGLTCLEYLGKSPELFAVITMRHALKLTKVFPKKEEMPALVEKHLSIKFPYLYNKKGKLKPETYDMADGCIVAIYLAFKLTNKLEEIKKNQK